MNKIDKLKSDIQWLERGIKAVQNHPGEKTTKDLSDIGQRKTKLFGMQRELRALEKLNVNKKKSNVNPNVNSKLPLVSVTSSSNPDKKYTVRQMPDKTWACSCPHFVFRNKQCKHIDGVLKGNNE